MSVFQIGFQVDTNLLNERGHKRLMNDLNRESGHRHRKHIFPKHFKNVPENVPASGGYRVRKRTERWNKYKSRKVGQTIPNLFRGTLRDKVVNDSKVTATANKWTVYTRVGFRMPGWQREEIERVTPRERKEGTQWMETAYYVLAGQSKYQKFRRQRTRKK